MIDTLPWHLQLKIYKDIGIDTCRSLNIKPGKLKIPEAFKESLERSLKLKHYISWINYNNELYWYTHIGFYINKTSKYFRLFRSCRINDTSVTLIDITGLETFNELEHFNIS